MRISPEPLYACQPAVRSDIKGSRLYATQDFSKQVLPLINCSVEHGSAMQTTFHALFTLLQARGSVIPVAYNFNFQTAQSHKLTADANITRYQRGTNLVLLEVITLISGLYHFPRVKKVERLNYYVIIIRFYAGRKYNGPERYKSGTDMEQVPIAGLFHMSQ